MTTGAGTWNKAELIPMVTNNAPRTTKFGANPNRLPQMAVMSGVDIMRSLQGSLCATAPTNKLRSEGSRCNINSKLAEVSDKLNLEIMRGSSGGRKLEYTSCRKCADERMKTLGQWNSRFVILICNPKRPLARYLHYKSSNTS